MKRKKLTKGKQIIQAFIVLITTKLASIQENHIYVI